MGGWGWPERVQLEPEARPGAQARAREGLEEGGVCPATQRQEPPELAIVAQTLPLAGLAPTVSAGASPDRIRPGQQVSTLDMVGQEEAWPDPLGVSEARAEGGGRELQKGPERAVGKTRSP